MQLLQFFIKELKNYVLLIVILFQEYLFNLFKIYKIFFKIRLFFKIPSTSPIINYVSLLFKAILVI